MSIPGFTAEASFARASGHYQTSGKTIHVRTQRIGPIGPALGISDETIDVTSCRPGFLQIGEGANITCVDPRDPFGTGGHQGAGETGSGGGEPADVGGDDVVLIYDDCTDEQINSKAAKRCLNQAKKDPDHDYYVRCVRNKMGCCYDYVGNDRKKHRECKNLTP